MRTVSPRPFFLSFLAVMLFAALASPRPASAQEWPRGATALCRDGTFSHSTSKTGKCFGHGGLRRLRPAAPDAAPATAPRATPSTPRPAASRTSRTTREYILGPRGGCYYLSPSGRKVYVDHAYCR